ncbi:MAG TPA: hypothetical protein VMI47_06805 [Pseudolabrys sp.]|nr:hypothetical protein [Pseudolabrys sp.]
MASETQALAIRPEKPSADDYSILSATLEASARGRAFLSEYARRNRAADTEVLLTALDRLSLHIRGEASAVQHIRAELRTLLAAIRLARPDFDGGQAPGKMAMLTQLIDVLEQRIEALVGVRTADVQAVRPHLAVVPPADEPELPIPSPVAQLPSIAVVAPTRPMSGTALMPEVNVLEQAPAKAAGKPMAKAGTPSTERLRLLAPIMALSEDERLALFS